MELSLWDGVAFVGFLAAVIVISLIASRKEDDSADYFLAGRRLTWWLIGFSLIASNISTEHFVGMSGEGFGSTGLAIASYEWIAAVSLVIVGLFLLPLYLKLGIYTMPEFLEHRYGPAPRVIMAVYLMAMYVIVAMAAVLYSGAIGLQAIFNLPELFAGWFDLSLAEDAAWHQSADTWSLLAGIWLIGVLAGAYTIYGGLKAVVWSDLIQGAALLLGGGFVLYLVLDRVGGLSAFLGANEEKLHMFMPLTATDADGLPTRPALPWSALLVGIWIPNIFYWGFNQFITQRALGARSLKAGQRGVVFAAMLKLLIPFIIIFPGIAAFQLFRDEITKGDQAYPILIAKILPVGMRGIMFAALFGAIMSSLDSMLNSASTIFTMDIFKRHIKPDAQPRQLVTVGRVATALLVVLACLMGPLPGTFSGVFQYIQMVWGYVSPGVVAVFVFGLAFRRAGSSSAAVVGLLVCLPVYGLLLWIFPLVSFLDCMAITFGICIAIMAAITIINPLPQPVRFEKQSDIDTTPCYFAVAMGIGVVLITAGLYFYFR